MAEVFAPDLRMVADYARAGAAGQAMRENAQTALRAQQQAQNLQADYDRLNMHAYDRWQNRRWELDDRADERAYDAQLNEQKATALGQLTQQKLEAAKQKDLLDHQQALEVQKFGQRHAFGMAQATAIGKDIDTVQKYINTAKLTPEGKKIAADRIGVLRALQTAQAKGYYDDPAAWSGAMRQWLEETSQKRLEDYEVKEPGPDEDYGVKTKDLGGGLKAQVRYDAKGNPYYDEIGAAKREEQAIVPAAKYFADPAIYDREEKAAKDRILEQRAMEFIKSGKGRNEKGEPLSREELMSQLTPPTEQELYQEMVRRKAERDRRVLDLMNGMAAPGQAPVAPSTPAEQPVEPPAPQAPEVPPQAPAPQAAVPPVQPPAAPPVAAAPEPQAPAPQETPSASIEPVPPAKEITPEKIQGGLRTLLGEDAPVTLPPPKTEREQADVKEFERLDSLGKKYSGVLPGIDKELEKVKKLIATHGYDAGKWGEAQQSEASDVIKKLVGVMDYEETKKPQRPPEKLSKKTLSAGYVYGPIRGKNGKVFDAFWDGESLIPITFYSAPGKAKTE